MGILQGTRAAGRRFSEGSVLLRYATLHVRCTCWARVACALCRSRACWRDWSTGSKRLDSTETWRRCSDSSWGSPEHLRQQRACTSPPGPRQAEREGQTSYSVGRINWLPAVTVEPWTRPRTTATSGDRTHRRSHTTPQTWTKGPAGFGPSAAPRMKQDSRQNQQGPDVQVQRLSGGGLTSLSDRCGGNMDCWE